jgi:hypothetical protein
VCTSVCRVGLRSETSCEGFCYLIRAKEGLINQRLALWPVGKLLLTPANQTEKGHHHVPRIVGGLIYDIRYLKGHTTEMKFTIF